MKTRILLLLSIVFMLSACNTSQKALNSGSYDLAINKALKKLRKNKTKDKQIAVLEDAYAKAVNRDKQRIEYLKREGQPDNHIEIFELYGILDARQQRVKALLPLTYTETGRTANFVIENYQEFLLESKRKAAEYSYALAQKLLESGNKYDARKAYNELITVKNLFTHFKDVDQYLSQAQEMGTSYALIKVTNSTPIPLPPNFERELIAINTNNLHKNWVRYHTRPLPNLRYDYDVTTNIQLIDISPEALRERSHQRQRDIIDGWMYAKDNKGNFVTDSLGNKLKVDKFVRVNCNVIEVNQNKQAMIGGNIRFINKRNNEIIANYPISAQTAFNNQYAVLTGNPDALNPNAENDQILIGLLQNQPLPFPTNFAMIQQTKEALKASIQDAIRSNRHLFD